MNRLYFGDNLKWLSDRKEFPDASVDLVYLDPPFNSNADYNVLFREPSGAVSGRARYSLMPDIPTVAESGLKDFEAMAWNGVLVPAGTPEAIVERLNREFNAALKSREVREKLHGAGLEPVGGTPAEFARLIRAESGKWAPVIRRTGATVD